MTKPRNYNVQIRDKQGKLLYTFKAIVVRKEQLKGRVIGDVTEVLFTKNPRLIYPKDK